MGMNMICMAALGLACAVKFPPPHLFSSTHVSAVRGTRDAVVALMLLRIRTVAAMHQQMTCDARATKIHGHV